MIDLLFSILIVPPTFSCLYLGVLAIVTATSRRRQELPTLHSSGQNCLSRFLVLIPAHDEERSLPQTLHSMDQLDYPQSHYDVCVIADNCTDNTSKVAAAWGARVLERQSPIRGKGAALSFAFEHLPLERYDGIVIIDADTVPSPNLLHAFHDSLSAGEVAIQGTYRVLNATDNWRTELMNLAFVLVHEVRGIARQKLGLSCGLKGNGMCFHPDLLRNTPPSGNSVTEDLEYTISLSLARQRVAYVPHAVVYATMPTGESASTTQRERWESGRWELLHRFAGPLLRSALTQRNGLALDVLMELSIPPLAHLAVAMCAVGSAALASSLFMLPLWLTLAETICGLAALVFYVVVGHRWVSVRSSLPRLVFYSLRYAAWKMTRTAFWRPQATWIRTARATAS